MADTNVILGLPSVQKLRDKNLIKESNRRTILHAFPNGGAPLTALLAWAKREFINSTIHQWHEKIYQTIRAVTRGTNPITSTEPGTGDSDTGTALVNGASITTSTSLYIKVASTSLLRVNQLLRINAWDITVRILEITRGVAAENEKGYVKVNAIRAFTYASAKAIAADVVLDVIGNAYGEGTRSGDTGGMRYPCTITNQTQIFKTPFDLTGSLAKTELEVDTSGAYKELALDKMRDHFCDIEKTLILGQRSTITDSDGKEVRTMSGILEFLKLWDAGKTGLQIDGATVAPYNFKDASTDEDDPDKRFIANSDGKISIDRWERWLSYVNATNNQKSTERLCLCGVGVLLAMNKAMRAQGSYQWTVGQKMFGLEFAQLVTGTGTLNFVTHPLFNEQAAYRNSALILDIWSLGFLPLEGRDTTLRKNIQENDADYRKDQWLTEATLEFKLPKNNMFVENISTYDSSVS